MRKARVRSLGGGAFDVECRDNGALQGFIGCPSRVLADAVAGAFVANGYNAAQSLKARTLAAAAPDCERCGFPAYNVNRHDEHTGRHTNERECFRAVYEAALEKAREELAAAVNNHVGAYHASEA